MPPDPPAARLEPARRSFRGVVALADLSLEVAAGQVTIARTDLRQLAQSPDFWAPMMGPRPAVLRDRPRHPAGRPQRLPEQGVAASVSTALDLLPQQAQSRVEGTNPVDRTSYALAVYLLPRSP